MKKQIILAISFGAMAIGYAQKEELKQIKKALSDKNYEQVISLVEQNASTLSADAKIKTKADLMKAQAYYFLVKKDSTNFSLVNKAAEALNAVPKNPDTDKKKMDLATSVKKQAIDFYNNKDLTKAMDGFETLYRLDPKDTVSLYNAASLGIANKETYDKSLGFYDELLKLNYDGSGMSYKATNKISGQEETFANKADRDFQVKLGTYENPIDEKIPSKKSEILKNVALVLVSQGKTDEAMAAVDTAIEKNPKDANLILSKADLYYRLNDMANYQSYIKQAIEIDPSNPNLYYNLGVSSSSMKDYDKAIEYYSKAIELSPDFSNAVLNMSSAYLEKGNAIANQMNEISDTKKHKNPDWNAYDKLRGDKDNEYKKAAKILENYLKTDPKESKEDVLKQLKNIYAALGDTDNFKRIKGLLGE